MLVPLEEQFAHLIQSAKEDLEVVEKDITLHDFLEIFVALLMERLNGRQRLLAIKSVLLTIISILNWRLETQ